MSVAQATTDRAGFTVGGVIGRMAAILRRNPGPLVVLAVVLVGVLPYLVGFAYARGVISAFGREQYIRLLQFQALILLPLTTILWIIFQGSFIHLAASGERGWAIGPSLRAAFRVFFPSLGVYLLTLLAMSLASVLLLFPGLMLGCRWMVVLPAEVVERTGVRGAMARSRDLTRGTRWRIFGLILIFSAVALLLGGGQFLLLRALVGSGVPVLVTSLLAPILSTITSLVGALGTTATYLELRRVKEGGTLNEIASVFE